MKITESLNPVAAKAFKASQEEDKRARSKEAVEKMAENLTRIQAEQPIRHAAEGCRYQHQRERFACAGCSVTWRRDRRGSGGRER